MLSISFFWASASLVTVFLFLLIGYSVGDNIKSYNSFELRFITIVCVFWPIGILILLIALVSYMFNLFDRFWSF